MRKLLVVGLLRGRYCGSEMLGEQWSTHISESNDAVLN